MKRTRVLDFVAYAAVGLLLVLLTTALALSKVPETTSKGIVTGCISGIAVFGTFLQHFWRRRHGFTFWAFVVTAAGAHLVLFALLGDAVRPVWMMLIAPVEYAGLAGLLERFGFVGSG